MIIVLGRKCYVTIMFQGFVGSNKNVCFVVSISSLKKVVLY